jgi:hypothetical protein
MQPVKKSGHKAYYAPEAWRNQRVQYSLEVNQTLSNLEGIRKKVSGIILANLKFGVDKNIPMHTIQTSLPGTLWWRSVSLHHLSPIALGCYVACYC